MAAARGRSRLVLLLTLVASGLASACSPQARGPEPIVWDRDTCAHCYMSISDRHAAAQLRLLPEAPAERFDDLGCALLFAAARSDPSDALPEIAELWVRDPKGEGWVDAHASRFRGDAHTPMDYGFVTAAEGGSETLAAVWARVREMEDERRSARR